MRGNRVRTKHMRNKNRRKVRIRDLRGLPARQVDESRAARRFPLLLHWAQKNGVSVISKDGEEDVVLVAGDVLFTRYVRLAFLRAVGEARVRNPGDVFGVADQVLGNPRAADRWMTRENQALGGKYPVAMLETDEGVEQVIDVLRSIGHGLSAETPSSAGAGSEI